MSKPKHFFPISRPSIGDLERDYVTRAVSSGWVSSLGEFIDEFEAGFARFCETRFAVSVANGTVALQLALKAAGIGPGDEVLVPDLSFIATANAVLHAGATPVFADVDSENLCLDPGDLEQRLTPRTRAIIAVDLYGHPADMPGICDFADRHGLCVIEDAAESHGASIAGRRVGSFGQCGCFSFYGNKVLTTGEGGMVTTDDPAFYERCRSLRDHAMSHGKRYWHLEPGFNFRMTNLQAALGCAQLSRLPELLAKRRLILDWYTEHLEEAEGIRLNRHSDWAEPVCWMVCLEFDGLDEAGREELMQGLRQRGVDSRPYFYPTSDMPYFTRADTPVTHSVYSSGINVPTYVDLSRADVESICQAVRDEWSQHRQPIPAVVEVESQPSERPPVPAAPATT
jgi:perosamine synthetase